MPLKDTLSGIDNAEVKSLGIRCENDEGHSSAHNANPIDDGEKVKTRRRSTGYTEWTPSTDFSIANSIENEARDGVGKSDVPMWGGMTKIIVGGWRDHDR